MKKIIRIIDRLNIGGPTIHVSILASQLDDKSYNTILVSGFVCEEEGNMSYAVTKHGVRPIYISQLSREIHPIKDLVALWKIYCLLRREQPRIVHTHKSKAGFIGRLAAILAGVPVIIHTFHGHVFHGYFSAKKTQLFLRIERFLARFTTRIITISKQQQQDICYKYRIGRPNKHEIIPLGFDFLPLDESKRGWLRQKYGWSSQDIVVGIVGRLASIKNHQMLLKVAQHIQSYPHIKFAIIGDGELREHLEQTVYKYNLTNTVVFTGWVTETAQIYSDLDIIALTSINEGTPVVVIEGMYYHKPVVATNVGGVADVVDEDCGFLCNSNDYQTFSRYLLWLANDKELRKKMGQHAHDKAKKMFSHKRLLQDIERLYSSLK